MADHPRLSVLKSFTALLEGINGADPWTFDLRGCVFRGRTLFGENDPETFVSILEAPRPDFGVYAGGGEARAEGWQLLVQGFTRTDATHPTDPLYPLLLEVEARLRMVIEVHGGTGNGKYPDCYMLPDAEGRRQISGLELSPPVVRPPGNEPTAKACFLLPLRVGLALDVG